LKKNLYALAAAALTLLTFSTKAQVISTVAGTGTNGYTGDGVSATTSGLNNPGKSIVDGSGNVYIADKANHLIRKVNTSGIISTIAGTVGSMGFSGDGGAATAAILYNPMSVCLDAAGNLYIADFGNNRIRMISTTGIITTIAGSTSGFSGDGAAATAAQISSPTDVAIDATGNLYICDYGNHHIRKINSSGIISSFAGTSGGFSGDGGAATAAQLYAPNGVCADAFGNVYIADLGNSVVRKVDAAGIITTYAGSTAGFGGDGGAATAAMMNNPAFLTTDIAGNVFISDMGNNRVRRASTDGLINTVAGTGAVGFSGDGSSATAAPISTPTGVAFDTNNNLYITSQSVGIVREVSVATLPLSGSSTLCVTDTASISSTVTCGIWTSSNPAVATVGSSSGLVTGMSAGTATINYDQGIYHGSQAITITNCALSATSISDADASPKLFPNPNNGTFSITLPESMEHATITIFDMLGKEVAKMADANTSQYNLNLTNMPAGTYVAKITAGNNTHRSIMTITQ